jgi:starch-binding outer membrane protein, SusD/RagB family
MGFNKIIKNNSIFLVSAVLIFGVSCKKFVAVDPPGNQAEVSKIFSNDEAAVSAAVGLYYRMIVNNLTISNGGVTVYTGLSADEFYNSSPDTELDLFSTNALIPDNGTGVYSNLWKACYQNIYHANAVMEGLANSTRISETTKRQLRGEMLVGRAFHYFYLINLFGDVPLITTTNYEVNTAMSRNSAEQVYQQITTDLLEAEEILPVEYPSAERARPNKYTATALLARVYLYQHNWLSAAEKAGVIIGSADYSLENNPDNTFLAGSTETIWQLKPGTTFMNTAEGVEFNPYDSFTVPKYSFTNALLNQFEAGDKRKQSWIASNNAGGQTIYFPYKYKVGFSNVLTEYYVVLRLAEMYLVRAEANANLNNITEAKSDINTIRSRAGLSTTTGNDRASVLSALEQENRLEFVAEWGHRWFDLKRTNRADAVLSAVKGTNWQSTDMLYPIPLSQIQINPALTQNPGY